MGNEHVRLIILHVKIHSQKEQREGLVKINANNWVV